MLADLSKTDLKLRIVEISNFQFMMIQTPREVPVKMANLVLDCNRVVILIEVFATENKS